MAAASAAAVRRALVPIAAGSEEIEAVCLIDTLRRAAFKVTVAGVGAEGALTMSRGVKIVPDCTIDAAADEAAAEPFDLILLPGGMPGAQSLADCDKLIDILRSQRDAKRWYGAICAAPAVALLPHGLLPEGRPATCHPAFADKLPEAIRSEDRVVVDTDHRVITSRGPGTAIEMAIAAIAAIDGGERADSVAGPMLLSRG